MVLDASDGCYYCSACYEEYYATVAVDAAGDPGVNEWMADEAMNAQHDQSERDGCSVDARIAEEGGDGVLDTAASLWRPVVEDVVLHEKLDDRVDEQKTGGTTVDRIRYDRVELGSLAEYLTGKCQVGDKDEQLGSSKPSDDVDDTCVPVADASTDDDRHHVEVHRKESFAASDELQEKFREACVATVDDDSLRKEEAALVDEDTVDEACENRKYSIARLLDLRRVSRRDCPECLLESPVRDDGSVCKRVHSRAGSSRKTSGSKLTPRSAACNKQTSGAATDSGQAKTPEKPEVTALVSPLPSLELCNTMRKVLEEKRQIDGVSCCDTMIASRAHQLRCLLTCPAQDQLQ